jgi:hypothetical protein
MTHDTIALIVTIVSGFGSVLVYFRRLEKKFDFILIEHEMLILDYAKRLGVEVHSLPTRTGGLRP